MHSNNLSHHPAERTFSAGSMSGIAAFLYILLLIYGTLFPLEGWQTPPQSPVWLMLQYGLHRTSWADLVTNILVYMPLGFLLMLGTARRIPCRSCRLLLIVLLGGLLSFCLEYIQAHLPSRVPSIGDLTLNTLGSGIGAATAMALKRETAIGRHLQHWRTLYLAPGALANIGLATLALWSLSQVGPLVPSLDLHNLRHGIKPLVHWLQHPGTLQWLKLLEYASAITALGLLFLSIRRLHYRAMLHFTLFVTAVLFLKIFIVSRELSPEALLGAAAGILFTRLFTLHRRQASPLLMAALLVTFVVLDGIQPGTSTTAGKATQFQTFNWIPFRSHLSNNIIGILDILSAIWPFSGLAFTAMAASTGNRQRNITLILGSIGTFIGTFALEWYQHFLPGRSADITDVLLAVIGWLAPWLYFYRHPGTALAKQQPFPPPTLRKRSRFRTLFAFTLLLISVVGGIAWIGLSQTGMPGNETMGADPLPSPRELPPLRLAHFHGLHPRLPAPSPEEILRLKKLQPRYLDNLRRRAKNGDGPLDAVITSAYLEPGSQDLDRLFQRLMTLKLSWRGHMQAKPLAVAYDWLYDQWNHRQRQELARKVVEASNYLIERIRVKQKLSPYNVYLYNSPFQALMATAIAAYGDVPEAELPMRWTADYWKNHVLPVWRQVMGTNGGWHEGAEYVGIGIGQAIYQVPAMWRKATGEDLFLEEPGIRGFSDFLVHRIRPDGTHMRLGDGRFFDRMVPDRIPLAMETGHRAAYSLKCPSPGKPTSWPWGPLTDDRFCDPEARKHLPPQRLFDGLGLVIARSDWSDEATFLTFKAGNNYWSHVHLDQGAFTLFKGAPLLIDSGYYGPGYNSSHRMNYSAQSIAHNLVTVTDPDDRAPMPPKKRNQKPRPIANDGGQRRVGSGWGMRAPLDLEEWQAHLDTYYTGRIAKYHEGDDLVVAVAELTPAYTNRFSGTGTFANRTFRVKKYWRTLVYDRRNDLLIVHDDVTSADPAFTKRSLLHTTDKPDLNRHGFTLDVPPAPEGSIPRHPGGHLEGFILFPENPHLRLVGGPGREFLVDGHNYDAQGKIWRNVSRRRKNPPEPGHWRLEISPAYPRERDHFLMVLVPGERDLPPLITPLRETNAIGARIMGLHRTLNVRFPTTRQGVSIEIEEKGAAHTLDFTLPPAPPLNPDTGILARLRNLLARIFRPVGDLRSDHSIRQESMSFIELPANRASRAERSREKPESINGDKAYSRGNSRKFLSNSDESGSSGGPGDISGPGAS